MISHTHSQNRQTEGPPLGGFGFVSTAREHILSELPGAACAKSGMNGGIKDVVGQTKGNFRS
jgi:hypothetical protein